MYTKSKIHIPSALKIHQICMVYSVYVYMYTSWQHWLQTQQFLKVLFKSRAKNKLCKVWWAVVILHQQFCSFCCLWCW